MQQWKMYLGAALALAVVGGATMAVDQIYLRPGAEVTSIGAAAIGGPFRLVDGGGKTVTDKDYRGKWLLVYFGYTHCPDVCPTTLAAVSAALDKLPANDRSKVKALFITVDPARDTPQVMGDYVAGFGNDLVGLSGSQEEVDKAMKAYRVYAKKHPEKDGDYSMDHSSIVYLMDPSGRYASNFSFDTPPDSMAKKLEGLIS
jgi:protein SCO1/2